MQGTCPPLRQGRYLNGLLGITRSGRVFVHGRRCSRMGRGFKNYYGQRAGYRMGAEAAEEVSGLQPKGSAACSVLFFLPLKPPCRDRTVTGLDICVPWLLSGALRSCLTLGSGHDGARADGEESHALGRILQRQRLGQLRPVVGGGGAARMRHDQFNGKHLQIPRGPHTSAAARHPQMQVSGFFGFLTSSLCFFVF